MWTLIVSVWCCGKLAFAPPLVFAKEADCRAGGAVMTRMLARDHVTPAAIHWDCIPRVAGGRASD